MLLNNFNAFHCFGLWLAVRIIPPSALASVTAISTVGVVESPKSRTSAPILNKVPETRLFTISPEILASLPKIIFNFSFPERSFKKIINAAVNLTMSMGLKPSPGFPPIVPLIPDIDFINAIIIK